MNADEQLHKLKQIPPLSKEEKRRKILTAVILTMATFISVLFLVYAFVQKQEADRNLLEAVRQRQMVEQFRLAAEVARKEADLQRQIAEDSQEKRMVAEQALAVCRKK